MPEKQLTIGSLFSGIICGGLELGLEWAGLGPVLWQVEKEPFCRDVLAKHWPDAARHTDVCAVGRADLAPVDVLCGGFPCQDISLAGKRAGLAGERSGLWAQYARIVRELRPRVVVVENVAALATLGMDTVLGDLAALGFDVWWDCVRASDVGAPHQRARLFIVAYARGLGYGRTQPALCAGRDAALDGGTALANAHGERQPQPQGRIGDELGRTDDGRQVGVGLADSDCEHGAQRDGERLGPRAQDTEPRGARGRVEGRAAESGVGRGTDGLSDWLDGPWPARPGEPQASWEPPRTKAKVQQRTARLKALGNSVSPAVAYAIGCVVRALLEGGAA